MLKKVMSIGFVAFFGLGLVANVSSEAMNPKKWVKHQKNLAKQQNNNDQPNNGGSDNSSDDDPDYFPKRKEENEELKKEEKDRKKWSQEGVKENIYSLGYYSNDK